MIRSGLPFSKHFHQSTRAAALFCVVCILVTIQGCTNSGSTEEKPASPGASTPAVGNGGNAPDVSAVMAKYGSLDNSTTSVTKLKASVQSSGGGKPEDVQLTMYHKRDSDGAQHFLVEFTSPPEERDRDALIDVTPQGGIQAVRYGAATKNFITAKSPTDEESLFGLTLQELIGGQPENYNYKFIDEESYEGTPVYRIEGTLKPGLESRFPRLVMLISKHNDAASMIEVYGSDKELARRLTVQKTEQVSGIWTRMKWTIDNQEQHKKVDFQVADVKYNQPLPDTTFTRDHLKQLIAK